VISSKVGVGRDFVLTLRERDLRAYTIHILMRESRKNTHSLLGFLSVLWLFLSLFPFDDKFDVFDEHLNRLFLYN
jgi:hypothetical protein